MSYCVKSLQARLRNLLSTTNKNYRKWLKKYSETVEQQMSDDKWGDIKYQSVPGQAMRKYRKAYGKRDGDRFKEWKLDNTKASVSASYPHDVIKLICNADWMDDFLDDADFDLAEKQWKNFMKSKLMKVYLKCLAKKNLKVKKVLSCWPAC